MEKRTLYEIPQWSQLRDLLISLPLWAKKLGLISFAGYRILSGEGGVLGVLALFRNKPIFPEEDTQLESLSSTTAQIIRTADAEEALRKNEEKFKLLAEHSADIIYKISLENEKYTYASPSAKKVFGYNVEELLSLKARDTLTPESYLKQRKRLEKSLMKNSRDPEIMEVDVLHKEGHTLPVEVHVAFISDDQGYPVEILGVARDISERKKAEDALRESERNYHDLYDNAPDMFVSVDAKTATILQCNQTLIDAIGYRKDEIIGRSIFDLYTADSAEHAKSTVFPMFVKTGAIEGEELQLQRKEGSTIDVSLNVSAIHDEKGNIIQSRSVWRDITKRKLMEAEVKTLSGFLPICASCKKIRDDKGYWNQIEAYIHDHSEAQFSHGICPECVKKLYPDIDVNQN